MPEQRKDASSSLAERGSTKRRYMLLTEAPPAQRCLVVLYLAHVTSQQGWFVQTQIRADKKMKL